MNAVKVLAVGAVALMAVACGRDAKPRDAGLSPALQGDLQRASAPTSELASSQYRPEQVVSAVELGEAPKAAVSKGTPKKQIAPKAKPSPKPEVQQVAAVAPAPSPEPTVTAPVAAPAPVVGPRPTPNPVTYPAGTGVASAGTGTHGTVGGIGSIIGVILRGGVVDGDNCDPRGHGGTTMPIGIIMPMPVHGSPAGTSHRPRAGW
ncbi:MAG: hypothetical protein ACREOJ_07820 [Gemmatimonadaceae bacterium]